MTRRMYKDVVDAVGVRGRPGVECEDRALEYLGGGMAGVWVWTGTKGDSPVVSIPLREFQGKVVRVN